jgi:hypothetical protein
MPASGGEQTGRLPIGIEISARIAGMTIATTTFYRSSNGDRWLLSHHDETGSYLVRHEPNPSSGGQPTEMPVPTFLAGSGTSPQAEALRTLLHKSGIAESATGE